MKRTLTFIGALLVAITAHAQAPGAKRKAQPVEVDRIVAVVNNEVLTQAELQAKVAQVTRQLGKQGTSLPPEDVLQRQILDRMVIERLQIQLAAETGLRVDDGAVERTMKRIADANRMAVADFRAALERDGIAWDTFREEIRNELLLNRVREREVDSRVVVSDAEVDTALAGQEQAVSQDEEFKVAHILLRVPEGASPEQLSRLRRKADDLLGRITGGEPFDKVAAAYSDAPDALSGGSIGWRSVNRLPALFAEVVTQLKPGEVSQVMKSAAGFHIVKLIDKRGTKSGVAQQVQQTHARHILIKTTELVTDTEARRRLMELRERIIQGGADFGDLARRNSADLTAAKGGDLGWLYPGDTVPEFEQAMDALKPGQVSEPVQSPFGWHLILVEERRVQDVSVERKRNAVRAALRERKAEEAYQDWLRQLRDRAYVEYRLEEK